VRILAALLHDSTPSNILLVRSRDEKLGIVDVQLTILSALLS
jgi:hypothetical protein